MNERFPPKSPGDVITAREMNTLGAVAERFARYKGNRGIDVRQSASQIDQSVQSIIPHHILEIVDMTAGDFEDEADSSELSSDFLKHSGLYLGVIRYFDHRDGEWRSLRSGESYSDAEGENVPNYWLVDASECHLDLQNGDKVPCYWDRQRGAFIPCETTDHPILDVTASDSSFVAGSSTNIAGWHTFEISGTIAFATTGSPAVNDRRFVRTSRKHENDGSSRQETLNLFATWYNEGDDGADHVDFRLRASAGRQATVSAALRIQVFKGIRQFNDVRSIGSGLTSDALNNLVFDTTPTISAADRIGGPNRPVFEVNTTHVRVRFPGPVNTNLSGQSKWTVQLDAQMQFTLS